MAKYPYQKMKNAELRKLCAEKGVDIDLDKAKRIDLVKALRAYDDQMDENIFDQAENSETKGKDQENSNDRMKGKVKLLVPNTNGERGSNRPLFVGCNGRSWFIPLEQPVIVPKAVKHALQLAVRRVTQTTDNGHVVEREARRVPFQILEEGPD